MTPTEKGPVTGVLRIIENTETFLLPSAKTSHYHEESVQCAVSRLPTCSGLGKPNGARFTVRIDGRLRTRDVVLILQQMQDFLR